MSKNKPTPEELKKLEQDIASARAALKSVSDQHEFYEKEVSKQKDIKSAIEKEAAKLDKKKADIEMADKTLEDLQKVTKDAENDLEKVRKEAKKMKELFGKEGDKHTGSILVRQAEINEKTVELAQVKKQLKVAAQDVKDATKKFEGLSAVIPALEEKKEVLLEEVKKLEAEEASIKESIKENKKVQMALLKSLDVIQRSGIILPKK